MRHLRFFIGLMGLTLLLGCASYKVRPIPQLTAQEAPVRSDSGAVAFGAKSYHENAECKAVFNRALCSKGVTPVLLLVDNQSSDDIEVIRAAVESETSSGTVLRPVTPDAASSEHGRNAMAEAIFFFGIFSYDDANRYNDDMARDWVEKGMGEVLILRPRRSAAKFVYFETGSAFSPSGSILRVPFERLGVSRGRETAVLRFTE